MRRPERMQADSSSSSARLMACWSVSVCGPIQWGLGGELCARACVCVRKRERKGGRWGEFRGCGGRGGCSPPASLPCTCAGSAGYWLPFTAFTPHTNAHRQARARARAQHSCPDSFLLDPAMTAAFLSTKSSDSR